MLSFWLGVYYGCVLGFLSATCYRHWASLYYTPPPDDTAQVVRDRKAMIQRVLFIKGERLGPMPYPLDEDGYPDRRRWRKDRGP